jgi:hypothetical protein
MRDSEILFGNLPEGLATTLVRSRFTRLSLMEADSPQELFSDLELDDVPEDIFDPAMSPGALAAQDQESAQVDPPAAVAAVANREVGPAIPIVDRDVNPGNAAVVATAPVVGAQQPELHEQARLDLEEQKGVSDYLRSYKGGAVFDGNHDSRKQSVQESWDQAMNSVRAACALSGKRSNLAKVSFLQPHLAGRPLSDFLFMIGQWAERREAELQKPNPNLAWCAPLPPYSDICSELRKTYLAGRRKSMIELTEYIRDVKLWQLAEKYGNSPLPHLVQCWQDYKALYRERAALYPGQGEYDKWSMITNYLSCLPTCMREILRHVKDANGQVKEPDDPVMLENSILALGDQFQMDLKRRLEIKMGKRPATAAGGSGHGSGGGNGNPTISKKRPLPASDRQRGKGQAEQKRPFKPSHIFWEYSDPKTQTFWIRDMDFDKIKSMKGKCLLCSSEQHLLTACPRRQKAFENKQFYAYNRPAKK